MGASHDPGGQGLRLLVVDDDPEVVLVLRRFLEAQGIGVQVAADGDGARRALNTPTFDLVLLDLGLPDSDGLALVTEFRMRWSGPMIIVSGRGDAIERAVGIELGADDYVTKPFDLRELLARIRAVVRRADGATARGPDGALAFDGLVLAPRRRRLTGRDGEDIPLTNGEFVLLSALLAHPQRVLTRDELSRSLHGREAGPYDRSVDVQVARLRQKIERAPSSPRLIRSVRGTGYLFAAPVERA